MQRVNTPIVPVKFLHLKYLDIFLAIGEGGFSPAYDYFSLVSFLDASPILESFVLAVSLRFAKMSTIYGRTIFDGIW